MHARISATLFERRKAYRGQFSETTIAFTARRRGETSRILHTVSRAHVKTYRSWRKMSETLFNTLVINGLPEKYEHFVVQESFNPASTFTELRTRLLFI